MLEPPSIRIDPSVKLIRWGQSAGKTAMSEDEAYLLGAFLGDGCLSYAKRSASGKCFAILGIDYDGIMFCRNILARRFQSNLSITKVKSRYYEVRSVKTDVIQFLDYHCGAEKRWPSEIWRASLDSQFALVAGLLDTDGFTQYQKDKLVKGRLYDQIRIGFSSTSEWLLDVMHLMNHIGIRTGKVCIQSYGKKHGHLGEKVVNLLSVNVRSFVEVGAYFKIARKQRRVAKYVEKYDMLYPQRLYAEHE